VQQPDIQPKFNNRGRFITGADGVYSFVGIKPVSYPIPDDGPGGQDARRARVATLTGLRICISSSPHRATRRS
jgi:protocatechuate 3,4-dioxygenase beta subunit